MTVGATRATTLTFGDLALGSNTLSTGTFSSSNTNARSINFGTGTIALTSATAAAGILAMSNLTNFSKSGTGGFSRNQGATATITVGDAAGSTAANSPNMFITGGASALTLSANCFFGSLDFTGSTCTVTGNFIQVAGDLTLATGGTYTGMSPVMAGTGTFTPNGKTIGVFRVLTTGTATLGGNLVTSSSCIIESGTFDANDFNISASTLNASIAGTRAVYLRSGTVTLSSSTSSVNIANTAGLTFDAGTSTIIITPAGASRTFTGGGQTFNIVSMTTATAGATITITGSNTFNTLSSVSPTVILFQAGSTQTIENFNVSGVEGFLSFLESTIEGTQYTLSKASGTITLQNMAIQDSIATGGATWNAFLSADLSNNSGWNFTLGNPRYWVGGTATWDTTPGTKWSTTSGGTGGASIPTLATPVFTSTGTITIGTNSGAGSITNSPSIGTTFAASTAAIQVNGGITFNSNTVWSHTGALTITGTGTITSSGKTIGSAITIAGPDITVTLSGSLTQPNTATFTLTRGTLDLGATSSLTTGVFSSSGTGVRSITFGTGSIFLINAVAATTVLSMADASNFTVTGTSRFSTAMSVTRTFVFGSTAGATGDNRVNIFLTSGSAVPTFTGSFRQIDFTGSTSNPGAFTINCHGFTLSSTAAYTTTLFVLVGSGTVTYNGETIASLNINGVGITTTVTSSLATPGSNTALILTNGTLDLNGRILNSVTASTAAGTKNITFNGGTFGITGSGATAWNNAVPAGFTTTMGTGTGYFSMSSASAKTFVGGGSTYNCTLRQAGAGTLTITGSNTFDDIDNTVQPTSILFTAATTNTFLSDFSLSGIVGSQVTIGSVTAASHTLAKTSGIVSVSHCTISRSNATGGAIWRAFTTNGNINGGNNTGWIFTPTPLGNFMMVLM